MQLVLDDQIGRRQAISRKHSATIRLTRAIKARAVGPLHATEEPGDGTRPGHACELIDCGNQEAWQPSITGFIYRDDGQGSVSTEITFPVCTGD